MEIKNIIEDTRIWIADLDQQIARGLIDTPEPETMLQRANIILIKLLMEWNNQSTDEKDFVNVTQQMIDNYKRYLERTNELDGGLVFYEWLIAGQPTE